MVRLDGHNTLADVFKRLEAPFIMAPMFLVSNPRMTLAACSEGIMAAFPAHGTRTPELLDAWITEVDEGLARLRDDTGIDAMVPYGVNIVISAANARLMDDLAVCVRRRPPLVFSSHGAPRDVVDRVHDYGGLVVHDVATLRHAEKAIESGVDGLIAVAAGAGGHTGTINSFALVNEIRRIYDGPLVLGGGISTGKDILAAQVMGADCAYIGTRFIVAAESSASVEYRQAVIRSGASDIVLTRYVDGAPANFIAESLREAGINLDSLTEAQHRRIAPHADKKRWKDIWSAGHGVGAITRVESAIQICRQIKAEYQSAVTSLSRFQSLRGE